MKFKTHSCQGEQTISIPNDSTGIIPKFHSNWIESDSAQLKAINTLKELDLYKCHLSFYSDPSSTKDLRTNCETKNN